MKYDQRKFLWDAWIDVQGKAFALSEICRVLGVSIGGCLTLLLDLFNREVVGWPLKRRMTADIAMDALTTTWFRKRPAAGLLHHFNQGSQYATHADMKAATFEYIKVSSHRKRQHSTLRYRSPTQFLKYWIGEQQKQKLVARNRSPGRRKIEKTSLHFNEISPPPCRIALLAPLSSPSSAAADKHYSLGFICYINFVRKVNRAFQNPNCLSS